jgi:hypothetical protein
MSDVNNMSISTSKSDRTKLRDSTNARNFSLEIQIKVIY